MVLSIPRKVSLAVSMEELERIHAIISSPVMIAGMPVPAAVVALAAVTLVVWLLVMVRRIPPLSLPPHFIQQAASPHVCGPGFQRRRRFSRCHRFPQKLHESTRAQRWLVCRDMRACTHTLLACLSLWMISTAFPHSDLDLGLRVSSLVGVSSRGMKP